MTHAKGDVMECPQCGEEVQINQAFCTACNATINRNAKALCNGCRGAFKAGDLTLHEDLWLCPLCMKRETQKKEGIPSPGHARMTQFAQDFHGHEVYQPPKLSLLAVVSLVSAFLCPIFGIPSTVLGIIALVRIRARPRELAGSGFAIGAIVLGALTFLLCGGIVAALMPLIEVIKEEAMLARVLSRMDMIRNAEESHRVLYGAYGSLDDLRIAEILTADDLQDPDYTFDVKKTPEGVQIIATPKGGDMAKHFLLDEKGVFHAEMGEPAEKDSPLYEPRYTTYQRSSSRTSGG
ncbi:MAG: DUF4190 domain-containing protein [Planctomycetota bacterium]|jgi:hypothetical protein